MLAVSGAPVPVSVDGRAHGCDISIRVPDGALVKLGAPTRGLRSYLAVRGGLECDAVLGSLSTDLLSGLGAPLEEGDESRSGPTRSARSGSGPGAEPYPHRQGDRAARRTRAAG